MNVDTLVANHNFLITFLLNIFSVSDKPNLFQIIYLFFHRWNYSDRLLLLWDTNDKHIKYSWIARSPEELSQH